MYCFKFYFSLNQTLLTANRKQTILIAMLAPRQKGTFDFSTSTTSPCQVVLSGLVFKAGTAILKPFIFPYCTDLKPKTRCTCQINTIPFKSVPLPLCQFQVMISRRHLPFLGRRRFFFTCTTHSFSFISSAGGPLVSFYGKL